MSSIFFPIFVSAIIFALYLVLAAVLLRRYRRTRDRKYAWLGVAAVLWLFASRLLIWGESVLIRHSRWGRSAGLHSLSVAQRSQISADSVLAMLNLLQHVIGVGVLLLAVLYFSTRKSKLSAAA